MPALRALAITIAVAAWSALSMASALSCADDRHLCNVTQPQSLIEMPSFGAAVERIDATVSRSARARHSTAGNTDRSDIDGRTMSLGLVLNHGLGFTDSSAVDPAPLRTERMMSAGLWFPRAYELNDQALLSRLLMTFGTALVAASAMRIFVR